MKISIVTISYNQAAFLRQTIESVLGQDDDCYEYIVVDAGSTDGSRDIISRYAGRISRVIFEPDQGPADGLNKGFSFCTGDIGYFLNSDDFLLPGALRRVRNSFKEHKDIDILANGAWRVDGNNVPTRLLLPSRLTLFDLLYERSILVQQGLFFRMSRYVPFNVGNRTCWDFEFVLDLVAAGSRSRLSKDIVAAFRLHSESITGGAGGEALATRYASDKKRIFRRFLGRDPCMLDIALMRVAPYARLFEPPSFALDRVLDRINMLDRASRYKKDA